MAFSQKTSRHRFAKSKSRAPIIGSTYARRLRVEALEDRRLLAVFSVSILDDAGPGSLRDAISSANVMPGADEIIFTSLATSGTIGLSSGQIEITDTLTITGPGSGELSIEPLTLSRVFNFATPDGQEADGDLSVSGLTITGGITAGNNVVINDVVQPIHSGGGIRFFSTGQLVVSSSNFSDNHTTGARAAGGAIYSSRGEVHLNHVLIEGNSTSGSESPGGAVFSSSGGVQITDSTLIDNNTSGESSIGGALATDAGMIQVMNSTFQLNRTIENGSHGGALATHSGEVSIADSNLQNNAALAFSKSLNGGAIYSNSGSIFVSGSILTGNAATFQGGGIFSHDGDVTLLRSVVARNESQFGGGIATTSGDLHFTHSAVYSNKAVFWGGGVVAGGDITVTYSQINENKLIGDIGLSLGGGIYSSGGNVSVTSSEINGNLMSNTGSKRGGGIYAEGGLQRVSLIVIDSSVSNNRIVTPATSQRDDLSRGGGIYSELITDVISSTISGNSVQTVLQSRGGSVYFFPYHRDNAAEKTARFTNSTISGNSVSGFSASNDSQGGGIFAAVGGGVSLTSSTVTGNTAGGAGGGVMLGNSSSGGSLTIANSIVAGNLRNTSTTPQSNDLNPFGPLTVSHSLIGINTSVNLTGAPVGMPDANGNLIGTAANPIDPLLGPLADNGGPTPTHALLPGSPAINALTASPTPLYDYRLDDSYADSQGSGAPLVGQQGVLGGGAYTFGQNQGLEAQVPAAEADDYSIEIRLKLDQLPLSGYQLLVDYSTSAAPFAGLYVWGDHLRYVADTETSFYTGGMTLQAGIWHHVVLTRSSGPQAGVRLYVDGAHDKSVPAVAAGDFHESAVISGLPGETGATRTLNILHASAEFGQPAGGAVDRIRFYDRPLTDDEVSAAYSTSTAPQFDQRGAPFLRDVGAGADMGAYEAQGASSADFDVDGDVDGSDFLIWQRGFGTTASNATKQDGDADGDGDVDADDLTAWQVSFGQPQPLAALHSDQPAFNPDLTDAALAIEWLSRSEPVERVFLTGQAPLETAVNTAENLTEPSQLANQPRPTELTTATDGADQSDEQLWLSDELMERVFG